MKKITKKLALHTQTVRSLATPDLGGVQGGKMINTTTTCPGHSDVCSNACLPC